jgi:UDP-N-acetylmuramate--alanine ligase
MNYVPPILPMRKIRNVFFVGIGGVGMSGIAEVMINLEFNVFGSDSHPNAVTARLDNLGATTYPSHQAQNVKDMDVVVVSSAIDPENVEVVSALEHRIPIIQRAEMLAELMRFRHGIAIAGTHGKTTTTSLVATVMAEGGLDPTFIVGGRVNSVGTNSQLGRSEYLVAEADESDASFLHLQPVVSVVTNIDADHLSSYENDFEKLRKAFVEFLHNIPFYGLAVLCVDDDVVRNMIPEVARPYITYGFSEDADLYASDLVYDGEKTTFKVSGKNISKPMTFTLNLPGKHNVLNALASIAVGLEFEVAPQKIASALKNFAGIGRRMQHIGTVSLVGGEAEFIDDYAHHPKEIAATVEGIRNGWPQRRIVAVFQPHRYTRTRDLFDEFVSVLNEVDVLLLLNVYPAGEKLINNADSHALAHALRLRGKLDAVLLESDEELSATLAKIIAPNDIVITLGAGSIGKLASSLYEQVQAEVKLA